MNNSAFRHHHSGLCWFANTHGKYVDSVAHALATLHIRFHQRGDIREYLGQPAQSFRGIQPPSRNQRGGDPVVDSELGLARSHVALLESGERRNILEDFYNLSEPRKVLCQAAQKHRQDVAALFPPFLFSMVRGFQSAIALLYGNQSLAELW